MCLHKDFSSSNYAEFRGGEQGSTNQNRVGVQRIRGLDRQAERTAMLTLLLLVQESVFGFPRRKIITGRSRMRVGCLVYSLSVSVCQ